MNIRLNFSFVVFLAAWLLGSAAFAQVPFAPTRGSDFDTPAAAAKALDQASTLQARVDLLRPVAATYLQAHAYQDLPSMISGLPVLENAGWQRTFLLVNLQTILGNAEEAVRLIKGLPDASLRDPVVLKFRIAHPEIFGDSAFQPPSDLDAGTPQEAAKNYLDTLEPDQAWKVIAAHADDFLDDLSTLHELTTQIADQNLASRLLPLLEERAKRQPGRWELRLTVAQFQILTGDIAGATESFRQIYTWKPDSESPSPTPAERVAAMQRIIAYGLRQLNGTFVFSRVKTLENARDLALICLAKLADERREGATFIGGLEKEHQNDEIGWITALMLIDSPGLVLRELHTCLAKGLPPGLTELALPWLRTNHPDKVGSDWTREERAQLEAAFAHVSPTPPQNAPGPAISSFGIFNGPPGLSRLAEVSKSDDPGVKERFLTELTASVDLRLSAISFVTLLRQAATQSEDTFVARVAAILLAKAVGEVDETIVRRAFGPAARWQFPRGRTPLDEMRRSRGIGRTPGNRGADAGAQSPAVNEQVEAVFLGQSAPPWSPPYSPLAQFSLGMPTPLSPNLAPYLDKLAGDTSSPLHVSARVAEAYLLHDVAGQEDHALDLLRETIRESPSYTARFWLTAFLARRQQYKEAAEVFDGIGSIPGCFEAFLQGGRTLLRRADKGEPLFADDRPIAPIPPTKRFSTIADLLVELERIIAADSIDPARSQQALAIAAKVSAILPAEVLFPKREIVLKAFAKFGGLDEQIRRIAERVGQFPASADAQLALGDAWALSRQPEATSYATEAYRKAFQLAPDRTDIAVKITGPGFSIREREEAYCVLLRQDATHYQNDQPDFSSLFKTPDALARYIRAYGEGFGPWGRRMISGSYNFRDSVAAWRKAGQDDAVIDMLTAIDHSAPPESSSYTEPEKFLLGLLVEKGRSAEAAQVIDRLLFPTEYLYGLDLGDRRSISVLDPEVREFVQQIGAPERTVAFEDHARRIMAEHPGGTRAPLVLLTLLITDRAPTLRAELPACLEALRAWQGDQLVNQLSALAEMASTAPETKSVALDLLTEARRRQAGKSAELDIVELIAKTALDMGEQEHAEEALRELLKSAKELKKQADPQKWTDTLTLLARAGMEPEAAELSALVYGKAEGDPARDRIAISSYVLAYIEACLRCGQPEMGRRALPDFQRLLITDVADLGDPQQIRYKFDQRFLERMIEAFVSLDRADEAAKALQTLQKSHMAAAAPELRARIESAQALFDQFTGGPDALPVAFVEFGQKREFTLWWNVSARIPRGDSREQTVVNVLATDLRPLDGRYSVEILGGDTSNHLTRLAVIPHAPGRGEWHGTSAINPASIRFTRAILTDADGVTTIGPSVPMSPGEERLDDPEMREATQTGRTPAPWTVPEGVLSSIPGPIPGHPAMAFVYKGERPVCEIRGARIPVRLGESFVQSAWLRGTGGCRWGVRCFDAQGQELTNPSEMGLSAPYETPGWTFVEQRLENAVELSENKRVRTPNQLPVGTAYIEPVLKLSTGVIPWDAKAPARWAGLSLRSAPLARDQTETPERAPDRIGPNETPLSDLTADKASTARNETVFAEFTSPACRVAVSPESDMILVGCNDGTLHFLEYPSGKELASVHAHDDPIMDLAVLPAKAGAYSVDTHGDTHFVSIKPEKDDLVACTAHRLSGAVLSPARKWVIFASDETRDEPPQDKIRIEIIDLTTGKPIRLIEQVGLFNSLSISPDEKQFSVRRPQHSSHYLVHSWELPSFNQLPDQTDDMGRRTVNGAASRSLFVTDEPRNRYVMVENTGRFVVRTMDNAILWSFNPAPGATSLAVMPKDGVIFVCKADGKVWRCVSPK